MVHDPLLPDAELQIAELIKQLTCAYPDADLELCNCELNKILAEWEARHRLFMLAFQRHAAMCDELAGS